MKRPRLMFTDGESIRKMRAKLGMTQPQFWGRVGITQSGGSRYENGTRGLPMDLLMLLHMTYAPDESAQRLYEVLRSWKRADKLQPLPAS